MGIFSIIGIITFGLVLVHLLFFRGVKLWVQISFWSCLLTTILFFLEFVTELTPISILISLIWGYNANIYYKDLKKFNNKYD